MLVKIINNTPVIYTLDNLRKDNPNVSFPKNIPDSTLKSFSIYKVKEVLAPKIDTKTHRCTFVVESIDNTWTQVWKIVELPLEQASDNVRAYRNKLLNETDWMALSDNVMPPEVAKYRQALRDISNQPTFPYSVTWPEKP